ncbi:MAG: TraY domain-containing protein [Phenylobacterium sp.]|uniref:TraY domain-containing protein n=1 Tax=Phenylobacterium sp. TaxID=1871053 RepID=UPI003BB6BF32
MADGELTLKLDHDTARRLKAAADAAGRSVDDYAAEVISDHLESEDDWATDLAIAEEFDRSGVSYSVEEAMATFEAALKAQVDKRR